MSDTPTPITDELAKEFAGKRVSSKEAGAVWNLCRDLERELEEARKQRDTLAEACRKLMKVVGAPDTNEWQEIEECDAAYLAGKKALAPVKGGQHE